MSLPLSGDTDLRPGQNLAHLLPPSWRADVQRWFAEDTPSFDWAGFVVGEEEQEAVLWGKSGVSGTMGRVGSDSSDSSHSFPHPESARGLYLGCNGDVATGCYSCWRPSLVESSRVQSSPVQSSPMSSNQSTWRADALTLSPGCARWRSILRRGVYLRRLLVGPSLHSHPTLLLCPWSFCSSWNAARKEPRKSSLHRKAKPDQDLTCFQANSHPRIAIAGTLAVILFLALVAAPSHSSQSLTPLTASSGSCPKAPSSLQTARPKSPSCAGPHDSSSSGSESR
jgi:hypothetical protein